MHCGTSRLWQSERKSLSRTKLKMEWGSPTAKSQCDRLEKTEGIMKSKQVVGIYLRSVRSSLVTSLGLITEKRKIGVFVGHPIWAGRAKEHMMLCRAGIQDFSPFSFRWGIKIHGGIFWSVLGAGSGCWLSLLHALSKLFPEQIPVMSSIRGHPSFYYVEWYSYLPVFNLDQAF